MLLPLAVSARDVHVVTRSSLEFVTSSSAMCVAVPLVLINTPVLAATVHLRPLLSPLAIVKSPLASVTSASA